MTSRLSGVDPMSATGVRHAPACGASEKRLYPDRTAGRYRDHRDSDRVARLGRAEDPRERRASAMPEQPPADRRGNAHAARSLQASAAAVGRVAVALYAAPRPLRQRAWVHPLQLDAA